jgi:hypothetical protein
MHCYVTRTAGQECLSTGSMGHKSSVNAAIVSTGPCGREAA